MGCYGSGGTLLENWLMVLNMSDWQVHIDIKDIPGIEQRGFFALSLD